MLRNYKTIKEINKKANANDQFYSKWFSHPLSILLVSFVENTKITPNILTIVSFLLTIAGTYTMLTIDGHIGLIITWLILHFALVFDSADGQLARYKKISSVFGAYLDVFTDHISYRLLIISLTIRLSYNNEQAMLLGLIVLALFTLSGFQNVAVQNIYLKNSKETDKKEASDKLFGKSKLKNFIGKLQDGLTSGYYMYVAITFIFNVPVYFLYILGAISTVLIIKRFFVFYFSTKNRVYAK